MNAHVPSARLPCACAHACGGLCPEHFCSREAFCLCQVAVKSTHAPDLCVSMACLCVSNGSLDSFRVALQSRARAR
eukprot:11817019-Alexandrium_andersonii.AAC.1